MSDDIRVLHYADKTSDKYWAIDTRPNAKGGHDVWYGRRGKPLVYRSSDKADWRRQYEAKLRKGYLKFKSLTIDRSTNMVVSKKRPGEQHSKPVLVSDLDSGSRNADRQLLGVCTQHFHGAIP